MTKTKALRQARSESYIRPQGSGWILGTWDDKYQATVESGELTWYMARAQRKEWIADRTAQLMNHDETED